MKGTVTYMILSKNKRSNSIKGIFAFALAAFLIASMCCISAFAESLELPSMPDMSGMIPDGTNIPDSDIGGAVGSDSSQMGTDSSMDSSSETSLISPSDTEGGKIPSTNVGDVTGDGSDNPETGDNLSSVLGIVIAVIVVLAVIMLIIALVPRRPGEAMGSSGKNGSSDSQKK